jgi:hypothetical protein
VINGSNVFFALSFRATGTRRRTGAVADGKDVSVQCDGRLAATGGARWPCGIAPRLRRKASRRFHSISVFIGSLLIAAFVSIPILNLATPLFGTAFMVRLYKRLAGSDSLPARTP